MNRFVPLAAILCLTGVVACPTLMFGTLPDDAVRAYLSGRDDVRGIVTAMSGVFARVDRRMRRRLVRGVAGLLHRLEVLVLGVDDVVVRLAAVGEVAGAAELLAGHGLHRVILSWWSLVVLTIGGLRM